MKNKMNRMISIVMVVALLVFSGADLSVCTVYAAKSTLKLYLGNSKTARHHKAVAQGEQTEELSFELKDGTVKSSSYSSNNPTSFKIVNTAKGKCVVEALKEGTGLVTLTVKTTEGDTYTEKLFISVYTRIGSYSGVANKNTDVYRGASDNAGVENADDKGDIKKNTKFSVTASCEDYYIIKTLDGTIYEDDKDTGFIKKADIDILADLLRINGDDTSVKLNNSTKLDAMFAPSITANKGIDWSSSNSKVAAVDSKGQVSGKAEGTVSITAATKDGTNKKDSVYVSVYKELDTCLGKLKTESALYKVANNKIQRGFGTKGSELTIVGQCGDYYRVKMEDKSLYTDGNSDEYCFVLKSKVAIPVQSIKLNKNAVTMLSGETVQLTGTLTPNMADNKNVIWNSSNKKVAQVNNNGKVTAKKVGIATITAKTEEGGKTVECIITVTEKQYAGKKANDKPVLKVGNYNFDSVLIEVSSSKTFDGFILYYDNEESDVKLKKRDRNTMNHGMTFGALNVNEKYTFRVKPYSINKNGKKKYGKLSNKASIVVGKVNAQAKVSQSKAITITWGKFNDATKYEIYRAKKKHGKYKLIQTVGKKKCKYVDKKVKVKNKYYYKVRAVRKKEAGAMSDVKSAKACKLKKAANYLGKKYNFICMNKKKKINSYNFNGNYPAVKYKFAKGKLEIHVYLEFVTYTYSGKKDAEGTLIYTKKKASANSSISTSKYISMFKKGIKKAYSNRHIVGGKGDFKKGINFDTKLVIHEKKKGKKYNSKQEFVEVLIGGECPNCTTDGDHWYHEDINKNASGYIENPNTCIIYMPTNEQTYTNTEKGYDGPKEFTSTSAHELGHALGLADAYYDKKNEDDRCAENEETAEKYSYKRYDNLMKSHKYYKYAKANDFEMMLEACDKISGQTTPASQYYKTYSDKKISKVIKNHDDNQKDTK